MCSYQPLDPTDTLSGEIVRRSEKNSSLSVAFHTFTTEAIFGRRTYFSSMEFVTTIDNPSILLTTWKLNKISKKDQFQVHTSFNKLQNSYYQDLNSIEVEDARIL